MNYNIPNRNTMRRRHATKLTTERGHYERVFSAAHIAIEPTTQRSHGHTLGRCTRTLRSYCVLCEAGCGCAITDQVVSGCNY
eukprot:scaffold10968_cov111-Skeletonema_dohrnii-CCMP3373.AAC.1